MNIKKHVRQRRQERIKQLYERQQELVDEPRRDTSADVYDPRWHDPEYVWKRSNPWNRQKEDWWSRENPPFVKRLGFKFFLSLVIFFCIWGMFQLDEPWAVRGQLLVERWMYEDFRFDRLADVYNRVFAGAPTFIPTFDWFDKDSHTSQVNASLRNMFSPVNGKIVTPYSPEHKGVTLSAAKGTAVFSCEQGRVVAVNDADENRYTVIIQHAEGLKSIYAGIGQTSLNVNDWVRGGEQIGVVAGEPGTADGTLFFALQKDNKYINPSEVITFD